ncbi:macro domain-containing protein [Frankia sp. Ag45/Mut15]|uniref:Macro domain-containing protein n=1 Tax=Frankia umida TaxID=573489 RepID=A0ABT0JSR1_9ACTN|nr:macro domain-containing protein [Frankia umida]MCK9874374.1 macro domain-containing protein [Frankia umida]
MIIEASGNLLEAEAEALVNTVNTVGVAGKGIALQFRQAFPENFKEYQRAARHGEVTPGRMLVHITEQLHPRYIINFPTKRHWRERSRTADIRDGLQDLVKVLVKYKIKSVAIPPLGCGNGGLDWNDVRPLVVAALSELDVEIKLYSPEGAPSADVMPVHTDRPRMTAGRAIMILMMHQYRTSDDFRLSALEVQKLAYFMQEVGEKLLLRYTKAAYGPYAENLNHVLQAMEGHYTRGYGDRSREPRIHLLPGAEREAESFLQGREESLDHLVQVRRLVDGWETPYGLELLATTHWALTRAEKQISSRESLHKYVASWTPRKAMLFKENQIDRAVDHLVSTGTVSHRSWM